MNDYLNGLNSEVREYFKILSPSFPDWILEYIDTPSMERIGKISLSCGRDYSFISKTNYFYSNLDHSVGVALIIWNFTHDKKATLAGLFHDIATPAFKHCIDFMNGDSSKQESTEERTETIIRGDNKITCLLNRDNIEIDEVCDYKMYPIADNDSPKLSADRLEYTFSSGLSCYRIFEICDIKKIYNNIAITKNEDGIKELAFIDKNVCEEYINIISKIWPIWIGDVSRTVMQFLADMCKSMNVMGYLSVDDLYKLSEEEIINKIYCSDRYLASKFREFQNARQVHSSLLPVENRYCVKIKNKLRYIVPLVITQNGSIRINKISDKAKNQINDFIQKGLEKENYYTYFDFNFIPYKDKKTLTKKLIL